MKEADIQRLIQNYITKEYPGSFSFKVHGNGFQKAGIPDLVCCINGRFIGIEVKQPGKEAELTKLQSLRIEQIRKAGGVGFMATSVEDVERELRRCLKK